MADPLIHNKHLLWRAGFGAGINELDDLKNKNTKTLLNELCKEQNFTDINYDTPDVEIIDYINDKTPAEKKRKSRGSTGSRTMSLTLTFSTESSTAKIR